MRGSTVLTYRPRPKTQRVILHCSHTPPSQAHIQSFLAVGGRHRGLLNIGYHFLILQSGKVVSTRPHTAVGAHCRFYNRTSIGICLAGGATEKTWQVPEDDYTEPKRFPEDNFTADQKRALWHVMGWLKEFYGPLPLVGHSELHKDHERPCPPLSMDALRRELDEQDNRATGHTLSHEEEHGVGLSVNAAEGHAG